MHDPSLESLHYTRDVDARRRVARSTVRAVVGRPFLGVVDRWFVTRGAEPNACIKFP